jgi:hypothetical protein
MSKESPSGEPATQRSQERRWLLSLIGLGVLWLSCELGILVAHINNQFYWILFWLLISGIPFVLAVWLIFRQKTFPTNTLLIMRVEIGARSQEVLGSARRNASGSRGPSSDQ